MESPQNAFLILPGEVWETIIEELDDSADIVNLLKGCPEMQILSQGKACNWLIDAVMPLIFPIYLKSRDIKHCRLVSRRWKNAVDRILEAHPDRLPYNSNRLTEMTGSHFNCAKLPFIATIFRRYVARQGTYCNAGPSRNPFPGRFVHFDMDFGDHSYTLEKAHLLLNLYGLHIWYATFHFHYFNMENEQIVPKVLHPLFRLLSSLPNLKSIKITGDSIHFSCPYAGTDSFDNSFRFNKGAVEFIAKKTFPFRLETIDFARSDDLFEHVFKSLVKALSNHDKVEKLAIHSRNWNNEYGALFPSLSELYISLDSTESLQNILQNLSSSPLRKLTIQTNEMANICADHILKAVAPYQIESLVMLGVGYLKCVSPQQYNESTISGTFGDVKNFCASVFSRCRCSNKSVKVTSVKYLRFTTSKDNMSFTFLRSLPYLQHLTISPSECDNRGFPFLRIGKSHSKSDVSLEYVYSNIVGCIGGVEWTRFEVALEKLVNIKMLTFHDNANSISYRFARECGDNVFSIR